MSLQKHTRKSLSFFEVLYLISPVINLIGLFCSGAALAIALSISSAQSSQNPKTKPCSETSPQPLLKEQTIGLDHQEHDDAAIQPVLPIHPVPEIQLWGPNYPALDKSILGEGVVTGGFMEDMGHSHKPTTYAIFSDSPDHITTLPPSPRNLGFDYVVHDYNIRNWYPGTVTRVGWEDGYGNRTHVLFDAQFPFNGTFYPLKGAYAHANSFSIQQGDIIEQGQVIGRMGGTGGNYPDHVDFRLWIEIDGKTVDVSPNLVDTSLFTQPNFHH